MLLLGHAELAMPPFACGCLREQAAQPTTLALSRGTQRRLVDENVGFLSKKEE